MKIKNILAAMFSVITLLSSCSKDSPEEDLKDTRLSVAVKASTLTKAVDNEELNGESNINSITVIQFTEDGSQLLAPLFQQKLSDNGSSTVTNIPSQSGMAKIVIITNIPDNAFQGVTSYKQMQEVLASLSDQRINNLTMSCEVINTKEPLIAGDNFIGYSSVENIKSDRYPDGINSPIEVTRLVARIDLKSLNTNFAGSPLAGRRVRVESVSINNIKTSSAYCSENYWGRVMAGDNWSTSEEVAVNKVVSDNSPVSELILRNYVMENLGSDDDGTVAPERPTQLHIRATLLGTSGYKEVTKDFVATVNLNGIVQVGKEHKYLKRNYVYRVNITFGKNSFELIEEQAALDVQVEVVGWGPVSQDVEIG